MTTWPTPPEWLRAGVGQDDFWKVGFQLVTLIDRYARIGRDERVLDAGCGLGRVGYLLAQILGAESTYDGFDGVRAYVDWCRDGYGLDPARFRFTHVDVANTMYNPQGALRAETLRFPFGDDAFTLTIATSLFTHLSAAATVNYIGECHRTLRPDGRLFATFYVLDPDSRRAIGSGTTEPLFTTDFAEGMISDANDPDAAIAFDSDWLAGVFTRAGFALEAYVPGTWRRGDGATHQDIVVARKS
ncbi:MAG TPA: class I SAM-dependent methyltransferase [Thermoanaerobaculia bacterium]